MTAPARPVPRTDRPPTLEQLLVLADRAERGPLTAAEAARLRQGIAALYAERRSAGTRLGNDTRQRRAATLRLLAVQALIRTARQRGTRAIPVQILASTVQADPQLPPSMARQGLSAPLSRPNSASATPGPSSLESASEAHSPANPPTNQMKAA